MTAPTRSAYPRPVDDLLPAARALAETLGEVPSRNRLMRELRIGAPKADELRSRMLEDPALDPPGPELAEARETLGDVTSANPWDYAEPIGPHPGPGPDLLPDPAGLAGSGLANPMGIEPTPASGSRNGHRPAVGPGPDPVPARVEVAAEPTRKPGGTGVAAERLPLAEPDGHPAPDPAGAAPPRPRRKPVAWPVLLLAAPAFVAIWAGWVELGRLTGFGKVNLLPGISDRAVIDTAITLPIGVETYAAYALWVWLSGRAPRRARTFARWSAIGSLIFGAAGQVAYHLMVAAGMTAAPWQITTLVSCLPVAVLGMGAALAHLLHTDEQE